jgi:acyl carrier protein
MVLENVIKIVAESLGIRESEIDESTVMEQVETWDSLTHMELIANLESEYQTEFTVDEIMEMISVKKIVEMVEARVNGN